MTWIVIAAVAFAAVVLLMVLRKIAILIVLVCAVGFVCDQANVEIPMPGALSDVTDKLDTNKHNLACNALAQQALGSDDQALWNQLQSKCPEMLKQSKQATDSVVGEGQ